MKHEDICKVVELARRRECLNSIRNYMNCGGSRLRFCDVDKNHIEITNGWVGSDGNDFLEVDAVFKTFLELKNFELLDKVEDEIKRIDKELEDL